MKRVAICVSANKQDLKDLASLRLQLRRFPDLQVWSPEDVPAGANIANARAQAFAQADVMVVLLSPDLSDPLLREALSQQPRIPLVPVVLRPMLLFPPFDAMQLLPGPDERAISQLQDPGAGWVTVARSILMAPGQSRAQVEPPAGDASPPHRPPDTNDPSPRRQGRHTILFLGADPADAQDRLGIEDEIKAIDRSLIESQKREHFNLERDPEAGRADLIKTLLRYEPRLLHFSGHGTKSGELVMLNDKKIGVRVPPDVLTEIFETCCEAFDLRCVVLSACYSADQAKAIAAHVPCVIGVDRLLADTAGRQFAAVFYAALARGKSIKVAARLGRLQAQIERTAGAEGIQLQCRPDIDPASYCPLL